MSAIYGVVGLDGVETTSRLQRMAEALRHHSHSAPSSWKAPPVGLGIRHWSVTHEDRHDRQPCVSSDRRWVVVFDGWLAGRAEVMHRLAVSPSTEIADSLLVVEVLSAEGPAGIARLIGAWAMAAWDSVEGCLHLWRAPMDSPPLHYHDSADWLAFASMPSALHAAGVRRQWDEQKLADMIAFSPADPDRTLFAGIRRLGTGMHLMRSAAGSLRVESFWRPDPHRRLHYRRDADYLEAFLDVFTQATHDACRTSGRVGVSMSGGLDSTAVAAVAVDVASRRGDRLDTYIAHWPRARTEHQQDGWDANEVERAQAMTDRHHRLRLHLVDAPGSSLDVLQGLFPLQERYVSSASNSVWMQALYAQAKSDGVTVLLNGQQGNLALTRSGTLDGALSDRDWSGALRLARALLLTRRWRAVAGAMARAFEFGVMQRVRSSDVGPLEEAHLEATPLHPAFARQHRVLERARAWPQWPPARRLPASEWRASELRALQLQDVGAFFAPLRAAWGVDTRSPATDVRVVEFCHAVPDRVLCRDGFARGFVPAALGDRLPSAVSQNRRRGEQSSDAFVRLLAQRARILSDLDRLQSVDIVTRAIDLPRLRQLATQWPVMPVGYAQTLPYRSVLEKGLAVAYFLEWWDRGGNNGRFS